MRILFVFILSGFFSNLWAQQKPSLILGDGYYVLPTQLFVGELIFTKEQFIAPRWSISYSLGYKFPIKGQDSIFTGTGAFASYEIFTMTNRNLNGIYLSLAPSLYLKKRRRYYFQAEIFNRFLWLNNKHITYSLSRAGFSARRTERINITGIKFLYGHHKHGKMNGKRFLNAKLYYGFSVRMIAFWYENVDKTYYRTATETQASYVPYEKERGTTLMPFGHIGFKIGLAKPVANVFD
ncbi:hypothetical protein RCC89_07115 [Cytophagaceae bacterium ABcell3]|nr:hypothetical protein RCC89_07115 [Cytophagaceae bacterium ABcell3]